MAAWQERLSAMTNLPAKYLSKCDASDPFWSEQSVCSSYESISVPILCSAGTLGGYTDVIMRLVDNVKK